MGSGILLSLHLLTLLSCIWLNSWVNVLHMAGNIATTALGLYDPYILQSSKKKKMFTLIVYILTLRGDSDCSSLLQAPIYELIIVAR